MATTKINAAQIVGTAGSPGNGEVVKLDATGSTGHSGSFNAITASYFKGDGSALTGISADGIDVNDSSADTNFRLVGVTAAGDPATLVCMDTQAQRVTMNALTGKVTISADLTVGDDVSLASDSSVFSMGEGSDATLTHDGTTGLTIAATPISINSTGDLTLDSSTDIVLDAAGGNYEFKNDGTTQLLIDTDTTAGEVRVEIEVDSDDLAFYQFDGTEVLRLTDGADVEVKDDMTLKSDASVLGFGADTDVTLTHVADTGLLLNSTMAIQFNDSTQYIKASSAADLDLAATTDINLDCTTVDVNGALDVSGASTLGGTTGVVVSAAGAVAVNNATDSTAATNGSLQTDGGLGVVLDASFGNDVMLISDAAVLNFGADSDVNLTHVADTGILLNSTMQLQFNDSSQYIAASSATVLEIAATDEIGLTATAVDMDANLDLDGTANISGLTTLQTGLVPDADDGAYLGTSALGWSDLFLAEGGVINWDNGDMTITQASDIMTIAGGTLTAQLTNGLSKAANSGLAMTAYDASAAVADLAVDFDDLAAATVDVANDSIAILDATDSNTKKESISDMVDAQAGNGLQGGSGQFSVTWSSSVFGRARGNVSNGSADGSAAGSSFLSCSVSSSTALGTRPQVYLNGLLQVQGSGSNALADSARDYAAYASGSNTVVLFKSEIDTDDVVLVRYIEN